MTVLLLTVVLFLVFSVCFFVCKSGYNNGWPNWDGIAIHMNVTGMRRCELDRDILTMFQICGIFMFSRQDPDSPVLLLETHTKCAIPGTELEKPLETLRARKKNN